VLEKEIALFDRFSDNLGIVLEGIGGVNIFPAVVLNGF
jgi:hypothetical protein